MVSSKRSYLSLILMLALTALPFVGCSDDDDDDVVIAPAAAPEDAPGIIYSDPFAGQTGLAEDALVRIVFSKEMDVSTLAPGAALRLVDEDGRELDCASVWENDNRVLTLDPVPLLERGVAYTVRIGADASDADGNALGYEHVLPFTVDGGWGDCVYVDDGLAWVHGPRLAMAPDGVAHVLWNQYDNPDRSIWTRRLIPGFGWGHQELVELRDGHAGSPRFALNDQGEGIVVWGHEDGDDRRICSVRYSLSEGWRKGMVRTVSEPGLAVRWPRVAMNADGDVIAVWCQRDDESSDERLYSRFGAPSWGARHALGPDAGRVSLYDLNMDADGNALAVYGHEDPPGVFNPYVVGFTPGAGWGDPVLIGTGEGNVHSFKVDMNPAGDAVVLWKLTGDSGGSLYANFHAVGTGWGPPGRIETPEGDLHQFEVDMNAAGDVMAGWGQTIGGERHIMASRHTAATGWETPVSLRSSTDTLDSIVLTMNSAGYAMAVWHRKSGEQHAIEACRYRPGEGWGTPRIIYSSAMNNFYPQVAMDAAGRAVCIWWQYLLSKGRIVACCFE